MERDLAGGQPVSRRAVGTYRDYSEAQRAVDYLSDRNFPVERSAIVAEGISLVEQVTGRLGYGRAALNGAVTTAIPGALFGYIFGLFNWIAPLLSALNLAVYGLIFGAVLGAVFGLIFHAASGGQRDFTSVAGLQAERYNLMVEDEVAEEAGRLLGEMR
jgi:hypothetical protein